MCCIVFFRTFRTLNVFAAAAGQICRAARSSRAPLGLFGAAAVALAGCASYSPLPLPAHANLARSLHAIDAAVPTTRTAAGFAVIDLKRPLTIDRIGLLAILNDPDLKSEAGTIGVANAGIVQATIIPNPVAAVSYAALVSGPGTTSALSASLAQSIAQIITRDARIGSAEFHAGQVNADLLWGEWQVAQKARQLAADIYFGDLSITLTREEITLLSEELDAVKKAIAAGNLTLTAQAPLAAALAVAENSLVTLRLNRLKNWQGLDALLRLDPRVRFRIARPALRPLPTNIEARLADLPAQRPDLAALKLGYESAQENVRAAILGQFPALTVGASYSKDTSGIVSAGPTFDLALPVFDRNQGHIAESDATRVLLRAQYQARLDSAVASVRALVLQIRQLSSDLVAARSAAATAKSLAATGRKAYANHNIDQRTVTEYETTAVERQLEVAAIERQISEDKIFVTVELGLDLPNMRIALSGSSPL